MIPGEGIAKQLQETLKYECKLVIPFSYASLQKLQIMCQLI